MQNLEYEKLRAQISGKGTSNSTATVIITIMTSLTLGMIALSATQDDFVWVVSQVVLGVLILQWFFLLHDLGHGHFFSHPKLNVAAGFLSSFFVMLPFFSWKFVHRHHHLWTGWKDKDPTMTILIPENVPRWQKGVINFCWKFWIPIFSLSFSVSNFWNVPKLTKLFPEKKLHFISGILFVLVTHGTLIAILGLNLYLKSWGLAYFVFLVLSDPLLLSQHGGLPQYHSRGESVGQFHFREQEEFTRSLVFPKWMQIYIFFGFNNHALHHLYPTLPGYRLSRLEVKTVNEMPWFQWLKLAKKTPAMEFLFDEKLTKAKTPPS